MFCYNLSHAVTPSSSPYSSPSSSTLESSKPSPLPSNSVCVQHLAKPQLTTTMHPPVASTVDSTPPVTSATLTLENPLILPTLMHHHQSTHSSASLLPHTLVDVPSLSSLPSAVDPTPVHPLSICVHATSIPTTASALGSTPTCEVTHLSVAHSQPVPHPAPASTHSQCYPVTCTYGVENHAHQFQFSIDIGSIHNVQLGEGFKCYLK